MDEIREKKSILCVGLDPQVRYIPKDILDQGYEEAGEKKQPFGPFEATAQAIVIYFEKIVKATASYAVIAKPQMAFYEAYGYWGVWAFEKVVAICKEYDLLALEDAKRCDGGDTAEAYAAGHLGKVDIWNPIESEIVKRPSLNVDAMTIVPQIGTSCVSPFVKIAKEEGKGIFLVDKTSFTPNSEIEQFKTVSGLTVWEEIALLAKKWGEGTEGENGYRNVGVVMGATYPGDAPRMREILGPNCFFLVPGYGAQGGGADGAVIGLNNHGYGLIVSSSRGIDYAYHPVSKGPFQCDPKNFAEAAGKAAEFSRNELNEALKRKLGKLPW